MVLEVPATGLGGGNLLNISVLNTKDLSSFSGKKNFSVNPFLFKKLTMNPSPSIISTFPTKADFCCFLLFSIPTRTKSLIFIFVTSFASGSFEIS